MCVVVIFDYHNMIGSVLLDLFYDTSRRPKDTTSETLIKFESLSKWLDPFQSIHKSPNRFRVPLRVEKIGLL